MVSSVGTGMMYLPFLRDGSTFVALGQVLSETGFGSLRKTPSFMEQHMSAGTPYVKSLYYDSQDRMGGLRSKQVRTLMQNAADLLRVGVQIPVAPMDNLSPEGRVLLELYTQHPEAGENIIRLRNTVWTCITAIWPEYVVYEIGPWAPGGACNWATTDANAISLRALRKKYGLKGFGALELEL
eukprot:gnl/TRDRNA2_/TRDRNA2_130071_c0_seq1.p1 gnl/TRDRNA2_/TRDRNA2_130071_c0~~gnl/TRDRNA2_/TRDRNA2_130071_c0_seq1.p1  ORF type:complete len:183 (+),score=26.47 gnl/TRDRNA2_/TRDRNA2_130071_c0_seq1:41-589(+)